MSGPLATATSEPLDALAQRLQHLESARHPLGLPRRRAEDFVREVRATGDVALALRRTAGHDRLAQVLARAKPADGVLVVTRLLPTLGALEALRRRFQGMVAYPLVLLMVVTLSGVSLTTVALPALARVADDTGGHVEHASALLGVVVAACFAALLALAAAVGFSLPVPLVSRGAKLRDRVLVLELARVLTEAGVTLPLAFEAASLATSGAVRAAALGLGRAFASGTPPGGAAPLLELEATALLARAAERGVSGPVLRALAEQARLEAERRTPEDLGRVQVAALCLGGLAMLALAAAWYQAYLHAVLG